MNWRRGDVVLCRVPMPSTQLQLFKIRPAVVVSANSLNQRLDDLMVVPCTSNTQRSIAAHQYLITGDETLDVGIRVDSVVRCASIFTLNRSMILRKLGRLSEATIACLDQCLKAALSI